MLGRQHSPNGANGSAVKDAPKGVRVLRTVDDLLRPAEWDRLPEAERARLAGAYVPLASGDPAPAPALAQLGAQSGTAVQEWVARLMAPQLQRDFVSANHHWLESAPSGAHFFAGGTVATGRT